MGAEIDRCAGALKWGRYACLLSTLLVVLVASSSPSSAKLKKIRNKVPPVVTWATLVDPETKISKDEVDAVIESTLNDPRSWSDLKNTSFKRVPYKSALLRIRVLTPRNTDRFCAPFKTQGYKSCSKNWDIALNADRWRLAAPAAGMALDQYRIYLINHEVGHSLGEDHEECPGPGARAPVMLQQTISLQGCVPNPWPDPEAVPSTSELILTPTIPPAAAEPKPA